MATKVLNDLANQLHLQLGGMSAPKQNIKNCLTVKMDVKENLSKKKRSYASKDC
jgi:hypothetical protein